MLFIDLSRHKFETYIVSDKPGELTNGIDETPDCDNVCGTVVISNLNDHCLMYGAEIDCSISTNHTSLNNYCEIKTSRGRLV